MAQLSDDCFAHGGRLMSTTEALDLLADSGVGASIITAVMRPNLPELPAIHQLLKERGIDQWTVQLAHATGRLAQGRGSDLLLAPEQLEELVAFLTEQCCVGVPKPKARSKAG